MGHYIESAATIVCVTAGVLFISWLTFGLIDGMSERHNEKVHAEKMACIEKATDDMALLACRGEFGRN